MAFRDLLADKKGIEQTDNIFSISLLFPKEEKYSLTDQIRRSSHSVCANLAKACSKRDYPKYYFSKLTDCIGENNETLVWIEFSHKYNYTSVEQY